MLIWDMLEDELNSKFHAVLNHIEKVEIKRSIFEAEHVIQKI